MRYKEKNYTVGKQRISALEERKKKDQQMYPSKDLSIQLNFLSLSICGHRGTLFSTRIPPSLLLYQLSPLSIVLFIQTVSVCCLVEGAELFSSLSPILVVSLRKYAMKRADYWKALKLRFCLLISPSSSLPCFHSCFFFGLSHTHTPLLIYHLISSEDEDWWRYFLFPSPCCWVLSLLLCPTKRLITVLPPSAESAVSVNEGLTDGAIETEI